MYFHSQFNKKNNMKEDEIMKRNLITVCMTMAVIMSLVGCGKATAGADPDIEDVAGTAVAEGMEDASAETSEPSAYTGYGHYINPEEAGKTAEEKETEGQGSASVEGAEASASATTEPATREDSRQESVSGTTATPESAPAVATPEPTVQPTPEPVAQPVSVLPECAQSDGEWYPPVPVFIILDNAEVLDEPSAESSVQGHLDFGTSIGSVGRSGNYIRVNYGAKPAWMDISVISTVDPLK